METLFNYSGRYVPEVCRSYTRIVRREFYDGELQTGADGLFSLNQEKALESPIALLRITSGSRISFRRAWHHIRNDRVGVRVIWFVRRGLLEIVRPNGTRTATAGQCMIVDSDVPFVAKTSVDTQGIHESYQAVVPAHLFLSYLPDGDGLMEAYSTEEGSGRLAVALLHFLFAESAGLSPQAAEPLALGFLRLIAEHVDRSPHRRQRQTCAERHRASIEEYVMKHLTDSTLTYDKVATNCGISPRYLSYLLKAGDTSFSELLWSRRLAKATEWLVSEAMRHRMIQEIAFMAGFKSAAHFSRMFRAERGCSPKEFRAAHLPGAADGPLPQTDHAHITH
jgi:AraC family transcriptional regulator, positive regulator of tynA and feaB